MRVFFILLGKELRQFFLSPLAYVILLLVMLLGGISFYAAVSALTKGPSTASIVTWIFNAPWFHLSYFPVFPLITMRLIAEERKMGTLEGLLTAPVRTWQLVMSKYLASVIFYLVLWVPCLLNFWVFQFVSHGAAEVPTGPLMGSLTIVIMLGLLNLAFGLFASAMARNQVIAAILSFTLIFVHFLAGMIAVHLSSQRMQELVPYFSTYAAIENIRTFSTGVIDSRPLVYYITFTLFMLGLTHQAMEFRRWKT
jgi:ABC-2 type transport system permease protein